MYGCIFYTLCLLDCELLYTHIGYLTQEPMIFDGSIKDNLLYAIEDISSVTDEVLWSVLWAAECEFVKDLEAQIGEKGIRLSGGERQRLAIAKLMLKNPEIIILDEPTLALDSFSEEKITQALDVLFKGRTVVIIAHRLQTIKKADNILVTEEGKVIEEGKHDELMNKKGVYYRMVELQSGF
jgi:ABC-type multidrug transport system fused ATPase/permease subunit